MLSLKLVVRCPVCERNSLLREWDELSYSKCTSREMRRAYKHLTDEKVFSKKVDIFFICPKCSNWSKGNQLAIQSEDPKLKRLGRQPREYILDTTEHQHREA